NQSMASRATRSSNRDPLTGEPSSKRKLLDDLDEESDDDTPQRKFQHTDSAGSKKASAKRKSIGGQDEGRLQKRKEQNRAAQRAFRERKERHVKDLEDKVSMLEQKTDNQAAENENLRELLTRLQQENLQLKQNQFNFTFQSPLAGSSSGTTSTTPTTSNNNNNPSSYQNRQRDATMAAPSSSGNAAASTSSATNPSPLGNNDGLMRMLSNGSSSSSNNSSANLGVNNINTPQLTNNSASPSELNLLDTFGIGASPEFGFTTNGNGATTNGMAGLTPPASSSMPFTMMDSNFFNNLQASTSPSGVDYNLLGDLSSSSTSGFAPMPYQTIATNPMYTSYRDPTANPNAWASFGPNPSQGLSLNTFDELFGGGGPISSTLPSADTDSAMTSMDDLMPFSFLPDMSNGGNATTASNPFSGLSPISQMTTPPSATSAMGQSGVGSSTSGKAVTTPASDSQNDSSATVMNAEEHSEETCPKTREEFADKVKTLGTGTFGPPVDPSETCTTMPMADATKLNLDIGTAWRAVRQHPQFEECDIDELCAELAKKATCDGTTKVIEAQQIMDIVHSIPERAKQRKASLRARSLA
ncbi:hypothetical protein CPB86DRAFT_691290, partial [Serendipita vermifera]